MAKNSKRKDGLFSWWRRDRECDLDHEVRSHLESEAAERREDGLSAEQAVYAARRAFGNTALIKEEVREMWGWGSFETLLQDIRYGLRQLRRNPGFTAVAVLTLALGIGVNTAIFSLVYSVLLRPLPFHDPERLVQLFETEAAPGNFPLAGADYLDWQAQTRTLEATSLFSWAHSMSAGAGREPEPVAVVKTQANFFDVMGVRPFAGRSFARGEDAGGKNHVAVLSYSFWQGHFGGKAEVIGKAVTLNDEPYIVLGVMPGWFNFPAATEIWIPLDMSPSGVGPRGNHNWTAVGRLKPGLTLDRARAELLAISERLEKQYPDTNRKVHAVVIPLRDQLVGNSEKPLLILLGAVALLLLIACANVANLLLARATTRQREMALRASLGAGRPQLIRQLLTESVLLASAGAALGILGAWWCVRVFASLKSLPIPRANPIEVDASVLLFTIALSVLTGIVFGLIPALQASTLNPSEELKAGAQSVLAPGTARRNLRDVLVVGEIAITLSLLVGAGLLLRSFAHLRSADIGVDPHNVLTMAINLPEVKYSTSLARRRFFDQLVERASHIPGVETAAVSREIPMEGGNNGYIKVDGDTDPSLSNQLVGWNYITPDYFRTYRIPLLEGRNFTLTDLDRTAAAGEKLFALYKPAKGSPFKPPANMTFDAIVSQSMAQTFWQNQNPVGRSFRWNGAKVVIIGMVADVKEYGIRAKPMPQAYFPLTLGIAGSSYGRLSVKTRVPPLTVLSAVRRHVRALDSGLAVFQVRTMDEVIAGNTRDTKVQAFLLASFAVLALILAAVGLYGVMSYLVTRRTREIGIRMAVGAQRADVLRLILKQGAKLIVAGIAIGIVATLALTRFIATLLYGVSLADPATFISVAVLLGLVAFAAYSIPARRACRIDPMAALRYE